METLWSKTSEISHYSRHKVNKGLRSLALGHNVETFCSGLDGLVERVAGYYAQGAKFAKWRAVLQITLDGRPSKLSIKEMLGGWHDKQDQFKNLDWYQ